MVQSRVGNRTHVEGGVSTSAKPERGLHMGRVRVMYGKGEAESG